MSRIMVRRLWRESDIGARGYIGAELLDGTLVALCSVEKWELAPKDSLRTDWRGNERFFDPPKAVFLPGITEEDLRFDGLGSGALRMTGVPL